MLDQAAVTERRRQILRVVLLVLILGTVPFYCLGFLLLATAPDRSREETTLIPATFTSIGGGGLIVSATSQFPTLSTTIDTFPTLLPTPIQYNPPVIPATVFFPSPTVVIFIPTSTLAPSLTFPPSQTPVPTETVFIPPPTDTNAPPQPTDTSIPPTQAEVPEIPPDILVPPTDTPTAP